MRIDATFRVSSYLTLGMACACLSYAAQPFLPEVAYLAIPVAALLLLAYLLEGRWTMTDLVANLVVTPLIAGGIGVWAAYRLTEPAQGPAEGMLFLVLMGSFLTVLMLAKLFRPKRNRDFWFLHFTAFIAVAISCALDSDLLFGFLLLGYLTCGMWSVALFYLASEQRSLTVAARASVPWRALGLGQAAGRAALVAAAALLLFLITPRAGITRWEGSLLSLPQVSTLAGDPGMDLNRTGTVRLSRTVAFEVTAEDANGNRKLNLDPDQHWRGSALDTYLRGRCFNWAPVTHGQAPAPAAKNPQAEGPDAPLPDLGPNQYFLTFVFAHRPLHRVYLAEPVIFTPPNGRLPVVFHNAGAQPPFARHLNTEVLAPPLVKRPKKWSYHQVLAPVPEAGLTPAVEVKQLLQGPLAARPEVPGLREFTIQLLSRLVQDGKLDSRQVEWVDDHLRREHHEAVARALEEHLASSGEYTYTLKLSRHDPEIDPLLDFLRNVKEGHCQRFAAGLAMMLRSVGVPARIVIGYRGGEHRGDGVYQVRQCDAHSWAEVLIQRGDSNWYWLTLEPTPSSDAMLGAETGWLGWWRWLRGGGGETWRSFIIDYNAEQQEAAALELWQVAGDVPSRLSIGGDQSWLKAVGLLWLLVIFTAVLGALFVWLVKRRRSVADCGLPRLPVSGDVAFYGRLLAILAQRRRLGPEAGQTPREFAEAIRQHLRQTVAEPLADIPSQLTRLYYRVRYACRPLSPEEAEAVGRRIEELDAGLAKASAPAPKGSKA